MSYELRPLSLAEILDAAFRLVQTQWKILIGLALVMQAPMILIAFSLPWVFDPFAQPFDVEASLPDGFLLEMGLALGVMGLAYLLLWPFVSGAVTAAIGHFYLDRPIALGEAARAGLRSYLRLLGCYFVYSIAVAGAVVLVVGGVAIAVGLGGALLASFFESAGTFGRVVQILLGVAAGAYAFFWLFFAGAAASLIPPIAVLESQGVLSTVRRAFSLGGTAKGRLVGIVFSAGMLIAIPVSGAQMLIGAIPVFGTLVWGFFQAVGFAFTSSVMVVLYFDFRCRVEHYDLTLLAEQVEAGPGLGHG